MPIDPSTLPVYQADQSYSNRAPASGIELSLPSTSVSPLVPIIEVDSEEEDNIEGPGLSNSKDDVVDVVESRPTSWVSSGAASIDTAWSDQPSQSPRSRSKSIKRKPVPLS